MEQVDLRQGLTASFPERLSQLSSPSRLGRYDQVWPVLVQLHHRVTRHFVLVKYLHHLGILSFTNPETNPFPHLNLMFWNWFPDPNHKWSIFIEQYWTLIGCSSSSPPTPKNHHLTTILSTYKPICLAKKHNSTTSSPPPTSTPTNPLTPTNPPTWQVLLLNRLLQLPQVSIKRAHLVTQREAQRLVHRTGGGEGRVRVASEDLGGASGGLGGLGLGGKAESKRFWDWDWVVVLGFFGWLMLYRAKHGIKW